jgi:hypothetical protein
VYDGGDDAAVLSARAFCGQNRRRPPADVLEKPVEAGETKGWIAEVLI